jgi:coenzyme F420 hydrogenase subunit beta
VEGRYALVALPCHLHALHKYVKVTPKLRGRVALTIGLYCNISFEPFVFDELCESKGTKPEDIKDLDFRAGEWPGGIYATMRDGSREKLLKLEEMKDEFNFLKKFYTPNRCNMCIDFSAEYADLAVGDPWLRGPDGKYLFEDGRTSVLVRTQRGDEAVVSAENAGAIKTTGIPLKTWMVNFEKAARYKREFVPQNIRLWEKLGYRVPRYNRPLAEVSWRKWPGICLNFAFGRLAEMRWFRRLGLVLGQTRPVVLWARWNRKRKEEKFVSGYARMEKLVEEIMPPPPEPRG